MDPAAGRSARSWRGSPSTSTSRSRRARSPPLPYNHPTTLDGVWWLVSGRQFRDQFDFLSGKGPRGLRRGTARRLRDLALGRATAVFPVLGLAGIAVLLVRRTAFGLLCVAILVSGAYVWANYLRLEHYLLVPWLVLGIGATVALEGIAVAASAGVRRVDRRPRGRAAAVDGARGAALLALGFAVFLGWRTCRPRTGARPAPATTTWTRCSSILPPDAAILSYWDASTPLWHAEYVEGRRPDVLIVDDTNIVYEGWGTREARIASLIC